MTYLKFALWLLGIYSTYYAALISWDLLCSGRTAAPSSSHELTFTEHFEPVQSAPEPQEYGSSSVMSSGGVSLKQLFNLAREESIEYTRPVSFGL